MAFAYLRYLASILGALKLCCKLLPLASTTIRPYIPEGQLAAYDNGVTALNAFCQLLETVEYTS